MEGFDSSTFNSKLYSWQCKDHVKLKKKILVIDHERINLRDTCEIRLEGSINERIISKGLIVARSFKGKI